MDFYNEIDPGAAEWLRELIRRGIIPEGIVDERSIEDITPDELRGFRRVHLFAGVGVWAYALVLAEWPDDVPVWTCSCPCQPFSSAGKGDGFGDERHLWPAAFHLISQCRPRVWLGEQVASDDGYAWLDLVQADVEGVDYTCGPVVTPAAGFGAPHGRHRTYIMAYSRQFPPREHRTRQSGRANGPKRKAKATDKSGRRGAVGVLGDSDRRGQRPGEGVRGTGGERPVDGAGVTRPLDDAVRRGLGPGTGAVCTGRDAAGGTGGSCRLAGPSGEPGCGEHEQQLQERNGLACGTGSGDLGILADADLSAGTRLGRDSGEALLVEDPAGSSAGCPVGVLGNAHGEGSLAGQPGSAADRHGGTALANDGLSELEYAAGRRVSAAQLTGLWNGPFGTGPVNGFWADAEWQHCRPEPNYPFGRWRPVEPGTFPLAHGASARVVKLRGYGNGLCSPQAEAFIKACLEELGPRGTA